MRRHAPQHASTTAARGVEALYVASDEGRAGGSAQLADVARFDPLLQLRVAGLTIGKEWGSADELEAALFANKRPDTNGVPWTEMLTTMSVLQRVAWLAQEGAVSYDGVSSAFARTIAALVAGFATRQRLVAAKSGAYAELRMLIAHPALCVRGPGGGRRRH